MIVTVHPLHQLETGNLPVDAIISIHGHNGPYPRLGGYAVPILTLVHDDVPVDQIQMVDGLWRGPTRDQVELAINWARDLPVGVRLACHCQQGKSRSAAIATAILADHLGPGREADAVRQLTEHVDGQGRKFHPNPLTILLADEILERNGAIHAALMRDTPYYARWCRYWVRIGCWNE